MGRIVDTSTIIKAIGQNSATEKENISASTRVCLMIFFLVYLSILKATELIEPRSSGPRHSDQTCSPCWNQWRAARNTNHDDLPSPPPGRCTWCRDCTNPDSPGPTLRRWQRGIPKFAFYFFFFVCLADPTCILLATGTTPPTVANNERIRKSPPRTTSVETTTILKRPKTDSTGSRGPSSSDLIIL